MSKWPITRLISHAFKPINIDVNDVRKNVRTTHSRAKQGGGGMGADLLFDFLFVDL